jgi:hypothetical protein
VPVVTECECQLGVVACLHDDLVGHEVGAE